MTIEDPVPELDARFSDPAAVATSWDDSLITTKIFAFAKGDFAQTRYRFSPL